MDVEHIKEIASYDPVSGIVLWKERSPQTFRRGGPYAEAISMRWNKHRAGRAVGSVNPHGYLVTCIEKKTVLVHRMAWVIHHGKWPDGQIDHINGDKLDNRIINLRDVCAKTNAQNKKRPITNGSGYIGVHFHKPSASWHARIMKDGVRQHLGSFDTAKKASDAYQKAKIEMKFHKNHGRS